MELTRAAKSILGTLVGEADRTVAELIRERGGKARNVRAAGHWATYPLGEVALAAANGDASAVKAIKIVKDAWRLGQKY